MNYKDTLNLPKTSFSMKANLLQKEPGLLKKWMDSDIYEAVRKKAIACDAIAARSAAIALSASLLSRSNIPIFVYVAYNSSKLAPYLQGCD